MGDKNEKRRQRLAERVSGIATVLRLEEEYVLHADTDDNYTLERAAEDMATILAQTKAVMFAQECYRRGALHENDVHPTQSPEYRRLESELAETREELIALKAQNERVEEENATLYAAHMPDAQVTALMKSL